MAGVYFITGKLGAGKSLSAVARIQRYLATGRPVATNLDLNLVKLCGPKAKSPVVYRLPDKPSIADFEAIGVGNASYDEEKNGLVVLDECGTWFNSRTWADKERQAIINWFLHARKLGWDLIFLVQSIKIVDKQARETLAEHVVYCRRTDKMTVPVVSALYKLIAQRPLRLPRVHVAYVRYGDLPTSLIVDRWVYRGSDLHQCYDTKQKFTDSYPHSTYQLLSPWLSHGRYIQPMTWNKAMRLTKIHWRRFSRPIIAGAFFAAGVAAAIYFREPVQIPAPVVEVAPAPAEQPKAEQGASSSVADTVSTLAARPAEPEKPATPVRDQYSAYVISGYLKMKDRAAYTLRTPDGRTISLDTLTASLDVKPRNNCHVRVISMRDVQDYADIYAPSCVPESAEPVVKGGLDVLPDDEPVRYRPRQIEQPAIPPRAISMQETLQQFQ